MKDLDKAYNILDTIHENDDRLSIYAKAKAAYDLCNDCLEAVMIMAKCEEEADIRIGLLEGALAKAINLQKQGNYHRLVFETAKAHYDLGQNRKALNYFLLLQKLDVTNVYHSLYYLMPLWAILEEKEALRDYSGEDIKILFPYMLALYKNGDFNKTREIFNKIIKINHYFWDVLSGKSDEDDENDDPLLRLALQVLRINSGLINSCPGFVAFVVKHADICYNEQADEKD